MTITSDFTCVVIVAYFLLLRLAKAGVATGASSAPASACSPPPRLRQRRCRGARRPRRAPRRPRQQCQPPPRGRRALPGEGPGETQRQAAIRVGPNAGPSSSSGMLRRDADARRPPAPGRATRPEGQPGRRPTRYQRGLGQEARAGAAALARTTRGPRRCATAREQGRRGQGARFCAGQRVSITNSLASRAPEVAREWHPTKNGSLKPADVVVGSNRPAWWRCSAGRDHVWRATIVSRTRLGSSCPSSTGHRASAKNSLAAIAPEIARTWHPTGNRPLRPSDVTAGSNRLVWWRCGVDRDHEWQTSVKNRRRAGCPFCSRQRASAATCLAHVAPEIAAEWHPTKNGALTPRDSRPGFQPARLVEVLGGRPPRLREHDCRPSAAPRPLSRLPGRSPREESPILRREPRGPRPPAGDGVAPLEQRPAQAARRSPGNLARGLVGSARPGPTTHGERRSARARLRDVSALSVRASACR